MKRLRAENPNSPTAFDQLWHADMAANRRQFDLYRFLAMMAGIRTGDAVVELGAGCSEFLSFLSNHRQVRAVALDYSPWAMAYMRQIDPRIEWRVGNALATRFADGLFDAVLAGELIEHLEDPAALIGEMVRIAKPGSGLVRLTTPRPDVAPQDAYHVWAFEPADLLALLTAAGLRGAGVETVGNYLIASGYRQ